ncbi:uncharacterized protein PHALS_15136 [Plasmopara halstedii]|uniref:Uncharacterized protein n=1 Tax=Plasmopara halstedii TaxID=4781 RepID=A0A0N7L489_PLAHL|nr:uncharacterized protein PHALS_15136 [Plasmopara halstedii]CEG38003.1 hypothetical protein PHALS_15136 [Plasmopara halstedii]|eukprot:XP_024574372.1 hypothetical protein PHALS_15136 [Plasmopara halstedii]
MSSSRSQSYRLLDRNVLQRPFYLAAQFYVSNRHPFHGVAVSDVKDNWPDNDIVLCRWYVIDLTTGSILYGAKQILDTLRELSRCRSNDFSLTMKATFSTAKIL